MQWVIIIKDKILTEYSWRSYAAFMILCKANNRTCGQRQRKLIMTTHLPILCFWFRISWPNTALSRLFGLSFLSTELLAIYFFFAVPQTEHVTVKIPHLSHEKTLWGTLSSTCIPLPNRPSWDIFNNVWTAVYSPSTLKGIRISDLHVSYCIFLYCISFEQTSC